LNQNRQVEKAQAATSFTIAGLFPASPPSVIIISLLRQRAAPSRSDRPRPGQKGQFAEGTLSAGDAPARNCPQIPQIGS
jgi:hypothetical protein